MTGMKGIVMRKALLVAPIASLALLFAPGVANAGGDVTDTGHSSHSHDHGTDLHVKFPDGSPSRKHGGVASISVCDFDSLDAMRDHYDGDSSDKTHDSIDTAFDDAVKIDGKSGNEAFDLRHKGCDKHHGHHDSSSSHHQTKVIPKGAPETGSLDDGSMGPS